ncbi:MAG TPA: hypothetical protein VGF97_02975 [Rhizomicrobium sp.]
MQRMMLVSALALLPLLAATGCIAGPAPQASWQPPVAGVVRDQKAAITIAHAVWLSMHPELVGHIGTEEAWKSSMEATLKDGVWQVATKTGTGEIGGDLVILVAQRDAHIVGIYLTQ